VIPRGISRDDGMAVTLGHVYISGREKLLPSRNKVIVAEDLRTPMDLAFGVSRQHGRERRLAVAFAVKRTTGRHDQTMSSLEDKAHASVDIGKSLFDSNKHP
jgi:hypothetical protein